MSSFGEEMSQPGNSKRSLFNQKQESDYHEPHSQLHSGLLEEMVRRLSEELARHQMKVTNAELVQISEEKDRHGNTFSTMTVGDPLPPWLKDASTLSPLLLAYDKELANKDAFIREQRMEINKIKEEVLFVVGENTQLNSEISRTKECLDKLLVEREKAFINRESNLADRSKDVGSGEKDGGRTLLFEENNLLIDQQAEYQSQVLHLEELLRTLTNKLKVADEENRIHQEEKQQQSQEIRELRKETGSLEERNSSLHATLLDKIRIVEESVIQSCGRDNGSKGKSLEDIVMTYQSSIEHLSEENSSLAAELLSTQKASRNIQLELDNLKLLCKQNDDNHKMKVQEADYFRSKAIQYEQKLHNMEAQESALISKVNKTLEDASTAQIFADECRLKSCESQKEIDRLNFQLSSVRKQVVEQVDQKVRKLQTEYKNLLFEKIESTKHSEIQIRELEFEMEQLKHQVSSCESIIDHLRKEAVLASIDSSDENTTIKIAQSRPKTNIYEEQVKLISVIRLERDEATLKASSTEMALGRKENGWERERQQMRLKVEEAEKKVKESEKRNVELAVELQRITSERDEMIQSKRSMMTKHKHEVNTLKTQSDTISMAQHDRIQSLKLELESNITTKLDSVTQAQTLLSKSDELQFRYKEEVEHAKEQLQRQNEQKNIELASFRDKLQKAQESISTLSSLKLEKENELALAKQSLATLMPKLTSYQSRDVQQQQMISDITKDRDSLLVEKQRLLTEIDELEMLKNRATRQRDTANDRLRIVQKNFHGSSTYDSFSSVNKFNIGAN